MGIGHYIRPVERPFTRAERERVTCLFGGLTARHDALILAAFRGLGYRGARIPTPTKADFQTGKEYCNPGMCNPAYFTVGALVNYLKRLRDDAGLSTEAVLRDYAFVTAGSSGPCRFGMYESEFRLGLRNSGFDGFRVLAFQQKGGVRQSNQTCGLTIDGEFAVTLLTSLMLGDLLNDTANRIRPYERIPGQTDRVFGRVLDRLRDRLCAWGHRSSRPGIPARLVASMAPGMTPGQVQKVLRQLLGAYFTTALEECAALINEEIEVDYTRPKPICKVIGEFWAQMTEGDGNFNMFSFLETQGAEAHAPTIMTWANYLLDVAQCTLMDEKGRAEHPGPRTCGAFVSRARQRLARQKRLAGLALIAKTLNREYERMRLALGGLAHPQLAPAELRRLANPYFDYRIAGGEGYLEVAKTIYYSMNHLAHMILSLKPFGCLPSTQSDGAQAAVRARYPDINFVPVETSGDGDINAYSRVLMALGDAKTRCKDEFEACLKRTGYSLDTIRRFCQEHRELRRPLQQVPRSDGVVGRAANFVLHVASVMDANPAWERLKHAGPDRGRIRAGVSTSAAGYVQIWSDSEESVS